jgi:glutamate-5-semialdehyde dehydrogenase
MLDEIGQKAKSAAQRIARATTAEKTKVLHTLADSLDQSVEEILAANFEDVCEARAAGLTEALIDRLTLTPRRLAGIAADVRCVAALPDPVGERFDETVLPNGLRLRKQRVPMGVLGVIYESRPNVTIDVAGLAIQTGNAVILRGGSETMRSNRALVHAVQRALQLGGLPPEVVQGISSRDRALVLEMLKMDQFIDMIIPRGGAELHRFCKENSRIPVITGGVGICHLFVDESAHVSKSLEVIHNAKTQRPSVCNALDTVLVHRAVAATFLPAILHRLEPDGVIFQAHENTLEFLAPHDATLPASVRIAEPKDFDTEWMSLVLGLKIVDSLEEAMAHIAAHSMGHSDGILTEDSANANRFMAEVDSAAVYVNASTRFTDGGQFGLGAEVAISTQRLHARGPMGLRELTTYKWVAEGDYHVRSG